jgi:hypothetical protein
MNQDDNNSTIYDHKNSKPIQCKNFTDDSMVEVEIRDFARYLILYQDETKLRDGYKLE